MNKHNTFGKGESQRAVNGGEDKFYTKQHIADFYSHVVLARYTHEYEFVEPTAGAGAFLCVISPIRAYDISPELPVITQANVFDLTFTSNQVIIGNPPFGMNASLAQSIFNHIASFEVKAICFIVPKTFKKQSMHNKLNLNYHCVFEQDVIDNAFTVEGKDKHVPCVFQIWEFKQKQRLPLKLDYCPWITFTTKEHAQAAVRRAGGKAGQLLEGLDHSESSTYFLQTNHPMVIKAIQLMDLSVVNNTAGVRSISKQELCFEVNKIMEILK